MRLISKGASESSACVEIKASNIHDSVKGARGSFLLQEEGGAGKILTIARWDTVEDWKAFWKRENPQEMQKMRSLGERISVKVYDEFADFTV
ncbi:MULTISPECIES: hypothetical protein [unclassified Microbulbifer]|uniref:hypothetical protein n=1 Tax=unclassified Microbulbifer TaxID=2619833 RepID=UPI0027E545EB|nr:MULTISPECIES: hypothetical protein [unclassified Microbulbifer]